MNKKIETEELTARPLQSGVKCPACKEGMLSLSGPRKETFWDESDADEKYWSVTIQTGHCWICGETQISKTGI